MPDVCAAQVGDLIKEVLEDYGPLAGFTVINELTTEVAADESDGDVLRIFLVGWTFKNDIMQGQVEHDATFDIEIVTREGEPGTRTRDGLNAIGLVAQALGEDWTLGGLVENLEEVDAASTAANGRDANGTSVQFRAKFYTTRDDWSAFVV